GPPVFGNPSTANGDTELTATKVTETTDFFFFGRSRAAEKRSSLLLRSSLKKRKSVDSAFSVPVASVLAVALLDVRVERARDDGAAALHLHEDAIVAGFRKSIRKRDGRRQTAAMRVHRHGRHRNLQRRHRRRS